MADAGRPDDTPQATLHSAGRSWIGRVRDNNEDSLLMSSALVAIADGVGGNVAGELASALVIERLAASMGGFRRAFDEQSVRGRLADANAEIALRVARDPALAGMATTFTGLFWASDRLLLAHIGDSRAFRLHDGVLTQETRDDSFVQELLDARLMTASEAAEHPFRSMVLKVLAGLPDDIAKISVAHHDVVIGDRWLLASDGLTDVVPVAVIEDVLRRAPSPTNAVASLIEFADAWNARDNVSIAVTDVAEGDHVQPTEVGGSAAELFWSAYTGTELTAP